MARRRREDHGRLADEDLLALAGRGDDAAFEALYDRHSRVCFSLAFRLLGDRTAAEDLVQDTFVALWRGSDRYSPSRGSVRTWLLAILRNRGVDRLRSSAAAVRRQEALAEQTRVGQRVELPEDERAIDRVQAEQVKRAMDQLPKEQLDVVRLAYFGGFTHHEIADILAVPVGTVKSRMRLGLERVRRAVGEGPEVATV